MYLYHALFVAGFLLMILAVWQYMKSHNLLAGGIRVEATVQRLQTVESGEGPGYRPVFECTDPAGNKKEFIGKTIANPPEYKPGETLEIVYDPLLEDNYRVVSYWGLYGFTLWLLSFSLPLMIIGGGYILYLRGIG